MKLHLSDLWRWDGTLSRGPYALWGCGLFALKYNLDRLVALVAFNKPWSPFSYMRGGFDQPLGAITPPDLTFLAAMVALALPFIYTGVVMTVRRLRDAGLPLGATALFFAPLINLLFFVAMAVVPTREPVESERKQSRLGAFIPRDAMGSAALALVVTTGCSLVLVGFSVYQLHGYGLSLFVGLPFVCGLVATLMYGYHERRTYLACLGVSVISVWLLGMGLLAFAVEGVICLLMAAPLAIPLAMLGGTLGYVIQHGHGGRATPALTTALLLFMPVLMGAESLDPTLPEVFAVTSTVDIEAPPERVWENVVTFRDLPAPKEWIFHTGIAYPIRARILGKGVGAVRRCEFTTGPFVEPITTWDAPHRLAFDVTAQPRAMDELSPWGQISAPHIDHFLVSQHGQFLLTALPGGRTRLEGTTWYTHRIWPATYWRPWSDGIIHAIHMRVLAHVKALSETPRA